MKNLFCLFCLFSLISFSVFANNEYFVRVTAYTHVNYGLGVEHPVTEFYFENGKHVIKTWPHPFPVPSEQDLLSYSEALATVAAHKAALESARKSSYQQAKPLERKQYENQFYALTEQLFNLTGVTNEVTPKLGFPELQAKIEQVQATDPMLAVNLSLKLLSIDSALKRYDTLWWDDAIRHEILEE